LKLLELFADASAALDQAALLLSAAISGGIGALLAGTRLYWRLGAKSVRGTVAGVRVVGRRYYAAYRYTLPPSGRRMLASADRGVRASQRLITGRKVRLLVFKKHPEIAAEAGFDVLESVGWGFFAAAALAVWMALTSWRVTPVTWTALGCAAFFVLYRLQRSMPARGQRPFTSPTREPPPEGLLENPVHPIEEILAGPVRAERQRKQRITGLIVTPILVLVGVGICALGAYLGRTVFMLQSTGEHVRGTVLFCELQKTLHGSSYYPVVQFTTLTGLGVQFRDTMGGDAPPYHEGEQVDVLYLPVSPRETATIDRGRLNWLAPGALCVGGFALAVIAVAVRLWIPRPTLGVPPPSSFR
jgi:Protein of unknown function (DUF3592)